MSQAVTGGAGRRGAGVGASQHTVVVALAGGDVQGCVPVVVDGVEVTAGVQEHLGNGRTAREGRPVQTDVLLLRGCVREHPRLW